MQQGAFHKLLYALLFLFLTAQSTGLFAEQALILKDGIKYIHVDPYLEYLEDPSRKMEWEQVLKQKQKWIKYRPNKIQSIFSSSAFWLRIKIVNNSSAHTKWVLLHKLTSLQYLDLYRPNPGGGYDKIKAGAERPYSTREIPYRHYAFHIGTKSKAKVGQEFYYIRIKSSTLINFELALLPLEELVKKRHRDRFIAGLLYGSIILMLMYNLSLSLFNRDFSNLYFGGMLLFMSLGAFYRFGYGLEFIKPYLPFTNQLICYTLGTAFSSLFVRNFLLLKRNAPIWNKIFLVIFIYSSLSFFMCFISRQVAAKMLLLFVMLSPFNVMICGYTVWKRGFKPARFFLLAWLTIVPGIVFTILDIALPESNWLLSVIAKYVYPISIGIELILFPLALADRMQVMRRNKRRAQKEALRLKEKYNQELKLEVQERTQDLIQEKKKLRKSLRDTQKLKQQQDGDYFLTSLLIKPLSRNTGNSPNVEVSSFVRQKKQFSYKQWDAELGGDLNVAHNLVFENRSLTVFINADAMGKSMQGAGGALVLGSAFSFLIERTKSKPAGLARSPETWLKSNFQDMNQLFQSFDGGMLISLLMGVVEDDTGCLYWINAEHPRPVLYREGSVEFLGNESDACSKLGDAMGGKQLTVSKFQLHPGDIFISGSDGRDDIKLPGDGTGNYEINSDENVFLNTVERNQGDLDGILQTIQEQGILVDDISLLRLEFQAEKPKS